MLTVYDTSTTQGAASRGENIDNLGTDLVTVRMLRQEKYHQSKRNGLSGHESEFKL